MDTLASARGHAFMRELNKLRDQHKTLLEGKMSQLEREDFNEDLRFQAWDIVDKLHPYPDRKS